MLQRFVALLLLTEMIQIYGCDLKSLKRNGTLSRRRRFLKFPDGSLAVINLTFTDALIWELTNSPNPTWNNICEADVDFKLPSYSLDTFGKRPGKKRRGFSGYYRLQRSERLDLFRKIEDLMNLYGVSGHDCMLRTLCEARERLKPGNSFVEDILQVAFRIPYGRGDDFEAEGYNQATSDTFCKSVTQRCDFSLLKYLLQE